MNDLVQDWQFPWHELQRSLAAGIKPGVAAQVAGWAAPALGLPEAVRSLSSELTWLGRARLRAALQSGAAK